MIQLEQLEKLYYNVKKLDMSGLYVIDSMA